MQSFRSKVDAWYWAAIASGVMLIALCLYVYSTGTGWMLYMSLVGVLVLIISVGLLCGIRYEVHSDHIHINGWIFGKHDIQYSDIIHIRKSDHTAENTACLSMERIEIRTKDGIFTISPDRDAFLIAMSEFYPEANDAI